MAAIRITDDSTPDQIKAAIVQLRAKQQRMPAHWADQRAEVADEIDDLVARLVHH